MLAQTLSASLLGVEGLPVRVEVDVAFGLPSLTIVGLAGSQVQEARERVRSALRNSGFELPSRRITVNLAPADVPKDGTAYDVAIAVGHPGRIRPAARPEPAGVDRAARRAGAGRQRAAGQRRAVAGGRRPGGGNRERDGGRRRRGRGGLRGRASPCCRRSRLGDVVAHLAGVRELALAVPTPMPPWQPPEGVPDLGDVIGQALARRALEIAVAGRHNLAVCGPPGVGKTLLLRCAEGLQPPLTTLRRSRSAVSTRPPGLIDRRRPLIRLRPFRAPHHTVSTQGLVGGGPRVRPGEASLAHRGILFLDEALEFRTDALDALRQPIEAGAVTIARVEGALMLPARFTLLMAFNPCPCGWLTSSSRQCRCDDGQARRYASRLSGPMRDRLDLWVRADEPRHADPDGVEPSATVAQRIRLGLAATARAAGHGQWRAAVRGR